MKRVSVAVAGIVGIFLLVQLGSLALVEPFQAAGYQTVQDPTNPTNSLAYIGAILVATVVMLTAMKFNAEQLIRGIIVLSGGFLSYYVFAVVLPPLRVGAIDVVPIVGALGLMAALVVYPEWYVIDAAGVVMGAGAAGLFGISFGLLPALILLFGLAVYDAISVYGTEHMLTLASGVMDLKVPVVLVVPLTLSYSYLKADMPEPEEQEEEAEGPLDRDAFFIGLGDAVMPTVLVASAAFFAPGGVPELGVPVLSLTLPALGAMVGTLLGLLALMRMVAKGRAHAGLPLLNGGAIAGYLVASVVAGVPLAEAVGLAGYV